MNEIQLLRAQLATERRRVRDVAAACAAADDAALAQRCLAYLECVLGWFGERDERLAALHTAPTPGAQDGGLAGLATLRAEADAGAGWTRLAQFLAGPWDARRGASAALLESNPRVADWRFVAGIDADSICQERALFAQVRAALPPGIPLA